MKTEDSLFLFKSLIKDGCEWQGDVFSKKWTECLFVPENTRIEDKIQASLSAYEEGIDWKREGNAIWIA